MTDTSLTRRRLLATGAWAGAALTAGRASADDVASELVASPFRYEIERSETQWRDLLTEDEYAILREGETEWPTTSPLWNDYSAGNFSCRGCGLHIYASAERAPIEKGWVFFYHAQRDTVLTDIDRGNPYSMASNPEQALIEVHCRRCASHLGHILIVEAQLVHCINGTSLNFHPAT